MSFFHTLMSKVRSYRNDDALDLELQEELEAHLAMAEEDFVRRGHGPSEARRLARIELGGVSQLRQAHRETRGLPWIDAYRLDIKLGVRMLRKSWGLTLIGGLAMAVVIAIGGGVFNLFHTVLGATVPLDEGDRIVALMTVDGRSGERSQPAWQDVERWQEMLSSVDEIGAFRTLSRPLGVDGPAPGAAPSLIAEMTPSGFELARVPARLGRYLVDEDASSSAEPVVVIGHGIWTRHFGGADTVIGRPLSLGTETYTVVGVMPEGFAFPVNHKFWIPLKPGDDGSDAASVFAFGRLAPGASVEQAQAEVAALGLLPAVEAPSAAAASGPALSPVVVPYTLGFVRVDGGDEKALAALMLTLVVLLLIPPCANIAILIYARTVTRQEEIAARYVLGASRGRIIAQLFAEVTVLALLSAAVALVFVQLGGEHLQQKLVLEGDAPFWIDFSHFSWTTVLFTGALAVLAAGIAGLLPAVQATGSLMDLGLRALGSRTGLRLGLTWTTLIVVQIALAVAVLPMAVSVSWGSLRPGILGPGFDADRFLTAELTLENGEAADPALRQELLRRLEAEPGFASMSFNPRLPGRESWAFVEIAESESDPFRPSGRGPVVIDFNTIDQAFLDTFEVELLGGRLLHAADGAPGRNAVLVNRTFAEHLSGWEPGQEILGRHLRFLDRSRDDEPVHGPWLEIVGVVGDLPANTTTRLVYHWADAPWAGAPGTQAPEATALSIQLHGDMEDAAARLRAVAADVDPALRLGDVLSLQEVYRRNQLDETLPAYALAGVTLSVLLLSAAGMYALMSFTVVRRRREIGIRSALGARPGRLLLDVFKRAFLQVAVGAGCGVTLAAVLSHLLPLQDMGAQEIPGIVPAAAVLMIGIGIAAALVTSRRGLKTEPTDALRQS